MTNWRDTRPLHLREPARLEHDEAALLMSLLRELGQAEQAGRVDEREWWPKVNRTRLRDKLATHFNRGGVF
jgi:hypothetical protein